VDPGTVSRHRKETDEGVPDTNICIYTIKHKPESVINNFMSHNPEDLCISSITYAELMHGVEKSQAVDKNRAVYV
jgi:tRNA(fMet)-specific endonuclease VapC